MDRPLRVRLTTDLTRYQPSLVAGTEGVVIGRYGEYSRAFDRFTGVRFPETTLDVLWSSLEIIDETYLREREQARAEADAALPTATDVVRHVGPKGGFRRLAYQYVIDGERRRVYEVDREKAAALCMTFRNLGIEVREQREP